MSNDYPGSMGRRLAVQLHARDARKLLKSKLPYILHALTPADIARFQKVLDAEVVDPVLDKQRAAAIRKEVDREHAHGIYRDPSRGPVHSSQRMRRINREYINVTLADRYIQIPIDYHKLLVPGALRPGSGLSEESEYLTQIKREFHHHGVYLEIAPNSGAPGGYYIWLSAGSPGRIIHTKDGRLTHEDLLEWWLRPIHGMYRALHTPVSSIKSVKSSSGIWFGIGIQGGGTFAIWGRYTKQAILFSLDSYDDHFWVSISETRWGLGLGGSGGAALFYAVGGKTPMAFDGLKTGGWDFQASLGEDWAAFAKALAGDFKELGLVEQVTKAEGFFKKCNLTEQQWRRLATQIKRSTTLANMRNSFLKPHITSVSIPGAGGGLELSLTHESGTSSVI